MSGLFHAPVALSPGKYPPVPNEWEKGGTSGLDGLEKRSAGSRNTITQTSSLQPPLHIVFVNRVAGPFTVLCRSNEEFSVTFYMHPTLYFTSRM